MNLANCKLRIASLQFAICVLQIAIGTRSLGAADEESVGHSAPGRAVTPVNQVLTPAGRQVDFPGMRPQVIAVSPDGALLAVSGKTSELVIIDAQTGAIRQRVHLPHDDQQLPANPVSSHLLEPDREGQLSFTGLVFSPNGKRIYMSNVEGSIKVFSVAREGSVHASHSLPLPAANAPRRKAEIPSGLALTPDGKRLYVCGNLSNRLLELDAATGKTLRTFDVGVAPYDVVLAGGKAYVSNWGGRRPGPKDRTGPAGQGTLVRVDRRDIASEGSVSIVDLAGGRTKEIVTGLHASGLAVSPDTASGGGRRYVVCANAGSDHLSVIDTRNDALIETVWARPKPSDLLGASPNALVFDRSGKRLYASNGAQNAIAVFDFQPQNRGKTRLTGLIPVGWYPAALALDGGRNTLFVANIKGLPKQPEKAEGADARGFNSHQYFGSVSIVPIPPDEELPRLSEVVAANMRVPRIAKALLPPRKDEPPRPVPQRIGEPSHFRHVVYIIKENRTYDQVFGDVAAGNGDPSLCIFGEHVSPNHHKLAREFVLLDNTYCAGILSADGHQWSTSAFSTDYMERSFAGFARSYPDGFGIDENDALAYSPAGFIWDSALKHGKTLRNYGEFMSPARRHVRWRDPARRQMPSPLDCLRAWMNKTNDIIFDYYASVSPLRPFSPGDFPGWEMAVPDQFRADHFLNDLRRFEAKGEFPNLTLLCLFNDHTSGAKAGHPTPRAYVADNDLALGRVVEGLSRSRFWKETVIFVIEDDPQNGWDHVSGYRTVAFCISPYTKRRAVVSTQYNTTSILRTIEQILGLPPMNQFDASATPMFNCFTEDADFAPYEALPANIRLDEMNPDAEAIEDEVLRADAIASSRINFRELDRAPEDLLNRILWRSVRGSRAAYPEWAISLAAGDDDDD
jgi:DNA-binding beta-propeller fold protein YncE